MFISKKNVYFSQPVSEKRKLLPFCVTQPQSQRKTRLFTLVLLSTIFEHLPSKTLDNHSEKSLSARCCLVTLKNSNLPSRLPSTEPSPIVQPQGSCYRARAVSRRPFPCPPSASLLFHEQLMNADGAAGEAVVLQGCARLRRWAPRAAVRPW